MVIHPRRRTGTLIGAAVVLCTLVGAGLLGWRILQQPLSFSSFTAGVVFLVLLVLGILFAYWTYGCWSLRYALDRNHLAIRWAGNEQRVPLEAIRTLVPGPAAPPPAGIGGLGWPGYHIGRGTVSGVGHADEVLFFSTHRTRQELLYVVTPAQVYALSPPNVRTFAQELKLRRRLGATEVLEQSVQRWLLWDLPAWHDGLLVGLIALGVLTNVALFAYQAFLMPALPSLLPVHFTPLGVADRVGFKGEIFLLPASGLLVLLLNIALSVALHLRERFAAYLTLLGALGVQGVLWGATYRLLG